MRWRPAVDGVGRVEPEASQGRSGARATRALRAASVATLVLFTWLWHVRTTGAVAWPALALLAAFVAASFAIGRACARASARIVGASPGVAYEVMLGFICGNTLLFVLTLVSPLGFGGHVALIGALAIALLHVRARPPDTCDATRREWGSLACIVFSGVATTLWVREQQPVMVLHDGLATFRVWLDVFTHAREISAFAQSHGLASIVDIKLAGAPAPIYHFASYMLPAALDALTSTSAIDAYVALQLPFGILLTGLATYGLMAVLFRATWPAVVAAAVVMAFPDSYGLFGVRFLAFHFMTQANIGMLYGLACIALAWVFMVEGCRSDRPWGVVLAYLLLAVCATYKAHLFVSNALVMMLYPCAFFGHMRFRIRALWRVLVALGLVVFFGVVVQVSQAVPRVPLLRLDGSGLHQYVNILMSGTIDGWFKRLFVALYYERRLPWIFNAALAAALIVLGTYGIWAFAAPWLYFKARARVPARVATFVLIVVANYQVMAMALALDDRGVGTPEEFVNRPHAWVYLVVVGCAAACATLWAGNALRDGRWRWLALPVGCLMLASVHRDSHELQTFPEWEEHALYAEFNTVPACFVRAAQFVRDHAAAGELLQDSRFDPGLVATAIAERQAFVIASTFGGRSPLVAARVARIDALQAAGDPAALALWASDNGVAWFLMHPEDAARWDAPFLERSVFACGGYRVFRLDRPPG